MRWAVALAPWQDAAGGANPGKRAVADQLPVIVQPGTLTALSDDTYIVPALVATLGDQASWRYVEFFAANINNPHTQRAYARACSRFFAWCEQRGLTLMAIRPYDVAAWVKELQEKHGPAGVKQQLAAVRMMFDWLITGQVMPINPAAAVRGPKLVVKTGKTPVLDGAEWRKLIDSIPTETVRDLRDRALIATLTYSFARITAALRMKVEYLRPKGAGWQIQLHEKGDAPGSISAQREDYRHASIPAREQSNLCPYVSYFDCSSSVPWVGRRRNQSDRCGIYK